MLKSYPCKSQQFVNFNANFQRRLLILNFNIIVDNVSMFFEGFLRRYYITLNTSNFMDKQMKKSIIFPVIPFWFFNLFEMTPTKVDITVI